MKARALVLRYRMSEQKKELKKPKDKREEREIRAEITYLQILIERYPEPAKRFVRKFEKQYA
jgi:hypothetical protein